MLFVVNGYSNNTIDRSCANKGPPNQESSTREYYLVFYHDAHAILDRLIQINKLVKHMQYADFDEIKEIGAGGYGTVYIAKYKKYSEVKKMEETVVLKRFNYFDETPELFISEVSNNWVVLIDVIFNLTLYLFLFNINSLEIMPSVQVMIISFLFME